MNEENLQWELLGDLTGPQGSSYVVIHNGSNVHTRQEWYHYVATHARLQFYDVTNIDECKINDIGIINGTYYEDNKPVSLWITIVDIDLNHNIITGIAEQSFAGATNNSTIVHSNVILRESTDNVADFITYNDVLAYKKIKPTISYDSPVTTRIKGQIINYNDECFIYGTTDNLIIGTESIMSLYKQEGVIDRQILTCPLNCHIIDIQDNILWLHDKQHLYQFDLVTEKLIQTYNAPFNFSLDLVLLYQERFYAFSVGNPKHYAGDVYSDSTGMLMITWYSFTDEFQLTYSNDIQIEDSPHIIYCQNKNMLYIRKDQTTIIEYDIIGQIMKTIPIILPEKEFFNVDQLKLGYNWSSVMIPWIDHSLLVFGLAWTTNDRFEYESDYKGMDYNIYKINLDNGNVSILMPLEEQVLPYQVGVSNRGIRALSLNKLDPYNELLYLTNTIQYTYEYYHFIQDNYLTSDKQYLTEQEQLQVQKNLGLLPLIQENVGLPQKTTNTLVKYQESIWYPNDSFTTQNYLDNSDNITITFNDSDSIPAHIVQGDAAIVIKQVYYDQGGSYELLGLSAGGGVLYGYNGAQWEEIHTFTPIHPDMSNIFCTGVYNDRLYLTETGTIMENGTIIVRWRLLSISLNDIHYNYYDNIQTHNMSKDAEKAHLALTNILYNYQNHDYYYVFRGETNSDERTCQLYIYKTRDIMNLQDDSRLICTVPLYDGSPSWYQNQGQIPQKGFKLYFYNQFDQILYYLDVKQSFIEQRSVYQIESMYNHNINWNHVTGTYLWDNDNSSNSYLFIFHNESILIYNFKTKKWQERKLTSDLIGIWTPWTTSQETSLNNSTLLLVRSSAESVDSATRGIAYKYLISDKPEYRIEDQTEYNYKALTSLNREEVFLGEDLVCNNKNKLYYKSFKDNIPAGLHSIISDQGLYIHPFINKKKELYGIELTNLSGKNDINVYKYNNSFHAFELIWSQSLQYDNGIEYNIRFINHNMDNNRAIIGLEDKQTHVLATIAILDFNNTYIYTESYSTLHNDWLNTYGCYDVDGNLFILKQNQDGHLELYHKIQSYNAGWELWATLPENVTISNLSPNLTSMETEIWSLMNDNRYIYWIDYQGIYWFDIFTKQIDFYNINWLANTNQHDILNQDTMMLPLLTLITDNQKIHIGNMICYNTKEDKEFLLELDYDIDTNYRTVKTQPSAVTMDEAIFLSPIYNQVDHLMYVGAHTIGCDMLTCSFGLGAKTEYNQIITINSDNSSTAVLTQNQVLSSSELLNVHNNLQSYESTLNTSDNNIFDTPFIQRNNCLYTKQVRQYGPIDKELILNNLPNNNINATFNYQDHLFMYYDSQYDNVVLYYLDNNNNTVQAINNTQQFYLYGIYNNQLYGYNSSTHDIGTITFDFTTNTINFTSILHTEYNLNKVSIMYQDNIFIGNQIDNSYKYNITSNEITKLSYVLPIWNNNFYKNQLYKNYLVVPEISEDKPTWEIQLIDINNGEIVKIIPTTIPTVRIPAGWYVKDNIAIADVINESIASQTNLLSLSYYIDLENEIVLSGSHIFDIYTENLNGSGIEYRYPQFIGLDNDYIYYIYKYALYRCHYRMPQLLPINSLQYMLEHITDSEKAILKQLITELAK